ncbi:ABC transporter ATP-binding protein [Rurimicrobium arvi]|uniref:ABC transporter ATP-binding protein n=1 Tax=Rurimicrobium arvi TaxID=2049916 RepID=A0ABP8MFZ3_9BACT
MKRLSSLNKYFWRHKWRLFSGILFVTIANLFAVIPPTVIRTVIDAVGEEIDVYHLIGGGKTQELFRNEIFGQVFWYGMLLLLLAFLRGIFMFLMRQTIIVMSRHIEYGQKEEIYNHYQQLDAQFFKSHATGDLMNRLSEDVSRVRMYTGPAIMYAVNLVVLTVMCVWGMLRVNPLLTLCVLIPMPILGISIYYVNRLIYKKSEKIQSQLSDLTTTAQEAFSGIRVIKSFVQEKNIMRFFDAHSEAYKHSTINLAMTEAIYFPAMNLFVGLSMLSTILVGGYFTIIGKATAGNIAEFVIYINLMMFPMFIIGMIASTTQRAAASQSRIDEFLKTEPAIKDPEHALNPIVLGDVAFDKVSFTYQHTGIQALREFSLKLRAGEKLIILGETGSGKSTVGQLLLRMYDPQSGSVRLDGVDLREMDLNHLRRNISYTPQDALLFSDTIFNNIRFGRDDASEQEVYEVARMAHLENEISSFADGYQTVIGERGVMLSGGQKQRIVLARALLKNSPVLLLDECLSAVDTQTEQIILSNLKKYLEDKTVLVITHRIFTGWNFDQIIVMRDGQIAEQGVHDELMQLNGRYAKLFRHQTEATPA